MEIKVADVAELVDARDLKSPHLSDLTRAGNPHEAGGDPAALSNTPPPLSAGWQALENVGRRLLTDIDKEVPCAAGFINDVVVVVEDGDREFVAAQISDAPRHYSSLRSPPCEAPKPSDQAG